MTAPAFDQHISVWHVVAGGWCATRVTGRDPCTQKEREEAVSHLLLAAPLSGWALAAHWRMNSLKPSHHKQHIYLFTMRQKGILTPTICGDVTVTKPTHLRMWNRMELNSVSGWACSCTQFSCQAAQQSVRFSLLYLDKTPDWKPIEKEFSQSWKGKPSKSRNHDLSKRLDTSTSNHKPAARRSSWSIKTANYQIFSRHEVAS